MKNKLMLILGLGFLIGLLGLALPIFTGLLFDSVIPDGSYSYLWSWIAAMLVVAFSVACFRMTQYMVTAQLCESVFSKLQTEAIARLVSLPVSFFQKFPPGELASRALGFDRMRELLTNSVIVSIVGCLFSVFNWILLFYLNSYLASVVLVLLFFYILGLGISYLWHIRALKKERYTAGVSIEEIYETLNGMSKIRISGSENRFFMRWLSRFEEQVKALAQLNKAFGAKDLFNWLFRLIALGVLFFVIAESAKVELSIGQYVAFHMALLFLVLAILQLAEMSTTLLQAVAYHRGFQPIFAQAPEKKENQSELSALLGGIELKHISFRYEKSQRQVLFDVSLQIEPGELVALVGRSGSGKSTLLRLLIGFENPMAGNVYFDGLDLNAIDSSHLRRQCGIVLQNDRLFPGSILDNIIGSSSLTAEDALEAVQMSGLLEDIKSMPMGLQTLVSDSAGLSGGQKQRILIARALVKKPRILFFDEATSALDNRTQKIVSTSLAKLKITRVVIAQRLSTIKDADRIFVLDKGHLVQSGKFDALMTKPGIFREMARRQLV